MMQDFGVKQDLGLQLGSCKTECYAAHNWHQFSMPECTCAMEQPDM